MGENIVHDQYSCFHLFCWIKTMRHDWGPTMETWRMIGQENRVTRRTGRWQGKIRVWWSRTGWGRAITWHFLSHTYHFAMHTLFLMGGWWVDNSLRHMETRINFFPILACFLKIKTGQRRDNRLVNANLLRLLTSRWSAEWAWAITSNTLRSTFL